ncbi:ribosome-associated translation inhibitor RaiA [Candidatus Saccharibacteria bacterium]|nr:ribosome-associated translation inhibitor RaiA [Candidatus Saccharibacteria bacterium]
MINLQVGYRGFEPDQKLKDYLVKKFQKLAKYLPNGHKSDLIMVELTESPAAKSDNHYHCHARLHLPNQDIEANAKALNPHGSIDLCVEKIKNNIVKYKDKHSPTVARRRLRSGVKRLFGR